MTITQAPAIPTFEVFCDRIEKCLERLEAEVRKGIDWVVEKWNTYIDSLGWDKYLPHVAMQIEYYARKLEGAFKEIWKALKKAVSKIWGEVKRLTGSPLGLISLSDSYSTAAGSLRDEKIAIDRMTRHVRKGWFGDAYFSYEGLATEQKNALDAVNKGLTEASTKCAESAKQIFATWTGAVDGILNVYDKVFACIKDATDVGQWPTLQSGVVAKLIGQTGVEILKLGNKLATFLAENETVNSAAWRNLNQGLDGLSDNKWPAIDSRDSGDLADKDAWTHQ